MPKRRKPTDPPPLFRDASQGTRRLARQRRELFLPAYRSEEARKKAHVYQDEMQRAHKIIVRWADLEDQGVLSMKETSLDAEFLLEVFGDALGYKSPTEGTEAHELERQYTVPGVGTADAAIGTFSASGPGVPVAVIELKGAKADLDFDRFNGRTPVQQGWDYLNALPECTWTIVSNFSRIRLYHRDHGSRAYEEFSLRALRKIGRFQEFYYLLGRGGLLRTPLESTPRAEVLLRLTGERQREVGDDLYDTYSTNRLALIDHLHTRLGRPIDKAIAIAQKLLDRIIFIAFCEDRGLLPDKIIERTYREVSPLARVTNPRWRNFVDLFHAVDKGHKTLRLAEGYNGGLFQHDPDVDELQLDDDWTDFFHNVGSYDFRDEVNVDVLGHLFEKSITELEKLRAGGFFENGNGGPSTESRMPASAQRKRFGVYYTPREFTAFIVQNTVGELLEERFDDLARKNGVELDRSAEHPSDAMRCYWNDCLTAIRDVKICDPACGSGAFLIAAYDFLEEQYAEIIHNLVLDGDPAAEDALAQIPDMILNDNLCGVDLSPEAVEITQLALWIRSARRGRTLADLSKNIVCGNSLVGDKDVDPRAMTWETTFPEIFRKEPPGFDCVIGNPPWERLKLQEREFFSLSAPKIANAVNAADRRRLIAQLEGEIPELHVRYLQAKRMAEHALDYARHSGRYPLTGKGDINSYAIFAELARSLVSPQGCVGLLVPSGIASDKTTKDFFNELTTSGALRKIYDFENKKGLFADLHRSFKFSVLVFGGNDAPCESADFVFFAHTMRDLDDKDRHIALRPADIALLNPNTRTCPIFRSRRDAELTKTIYRRVPILVDKNRKEGGNPWCITFFTMFHQTNDAELFHTAEQLQEMGFKLAGNRWKRRNRVFLPLYEAKMVQAYDHRAAGVTVEQENWMRQGQTDPTSLVAHQNPEFTVQPRWWVDSAEIDRGLQGRTRPGYLCYKDVTSPTNERTMIAAFVPHVGVVNSAPLVLCAENVGPMLECCLLANLNSFALDFVARQKVGNIHLNFFIVEQLPLFPPDAYTERCPWNERQSLERWISDRVLKLTCTANDMRPLADAAGFKHGVHKWKTDERAQLRAELDAAYFLLYGLSRDEAEYILSTFTGTQRRDTSDVGTYRTAELILEAYDGLAAR